MRIPNLTYSNNLLISAPKIDTDFLWDISILFIILAAVYFIGVFFYRNRRSSHSKKVRDRKRELSPMVSEFLFLEEDASKDEKSNYIALKIEIRQLLKDSFNRRVLSEILLDLRKDVSGEARQTLLKLYQDFGLHQDAFAKLKSWRWEVVSKGILELTRMEVEESYPFITKFINDKRSTIRKQAEIATVTLRSEGINYFMDTTKYKISEWQQLKLLDVIRNKTNFQPPRFKAWLTSNNKYVVLFALRLIKYYNQNDANTSLIELVKHKNNKIKEEAIACIKEFNVTESLDTLKLVFWKCSIDVKIAILDAISEIGDHADIDFLNLIDKKELNFSVKSKALSSINAISPESIMPSKGIQDESRYSIPDDIEEKVAKINAEEHAEIFGEKEDFIDVEIPEEEEGIAEEIKPIEEVDSQLKEEVDTCDNSDESQDLYQIEVIEELEINFEENIVKNMIDDAYWDISHLNFLPIVVDTEEHEIAPESKYNYDSSNSTPMEDLSNIEIVEGEIVPYRKKEGSKKEIQTSELSPFFKEFDMNELAFLPIVIDSESEVGEEKNDDAVDEKFNLLEIPVQYDEVLPKQQEKAPKQESLETELKFDLEPLHQLNDFDISEHSRSIVSPGYEIYNIDEILDAQVIYEEVSNKELILEINDIEVIEPHIVSATRPETLKETIMAKEEESDEIKLAIENERLLQEIISDLITPDNSKSKEDIIDGDSFINPDWDLDEDELDFIPVSLKKDKQTPQYIRIDKTQIDDEGEAAIPRASIPKAIFGDIEFEASTRQLLNDLEEMGNHREIPFLKELLAHEKYDLFKERINGLIDTFNHSEEKEQLENPLQPFSVFKDLFRTCDTEAKLILLDEVVGVGDEKELHFLEDLTKDDSPEIRRKAQLVLKELKIKLGRNTEDELNHNPSNNKVLQSIDFSESIEVPGSKPSNNPDDIFDLNFELKVDSDSDDDEKKKGR